MIEAVEGMRLNVPDLVCSLPLLYDLIVFDIDPVIVICAKAEPECNF